MSTLDWFQAKSYVAGSFLAPPTFCIINQPWTSLYDNHNQCLGCDSYLFITTFNGKLSWRHWISGGLMVCTTVGGPRENDRLSITIHLFIHSSIHPISLYISTNLFITFKLPQFHPFTLNSHRSSSPSLNHPHFTLVHLSSPSSPQGSQRLSIQFLFQRTLIHSRSDRSLAPDDVIVDEWNCLFATSVVRQSFIP